MDTALGESLSEEQTPSGELHITFEEQKPTTISEKCAHVPNEPILTPIGVVNPFLQCIKGNSEMSNYVSLEDQQKPLSPDSSPSVQAEIKPESTGAFDDNSADPYESSDELHEDEMNKFLQMVESERNQPTE
jgi:hypothetical protein